MNPEAPAFSPSDSGGAPAAKRKGKAKGKGKRGGGGAAAAVDAADAGCASRVYPQGRNYSPSGSLYAPTVLRDVASAGYSPTGARYSAVQLAVCRAHALADSERRAIRTQAAFYFSDANVGAGLRAAGAALG